MPQLITISKVTDCRTARLGHRACLIVNSGAEKNIQLWAQAEECTLCDYQELYNVGKLENVSFAIETDYQHSFRYTFNDSEWCLKNFTFNEYGIYMWNISYDTCSDLDIIRKPVSQFLPIIAAISLLLILSLLFCGLSYFLESGWFTKFGRRRVSFTDIEKDLDKPNTGDVPPVIRSEAPQIIRQQNRVASLDVFRGLTIALMIFVHYGGGGYKIFSARNWYGITFRDLPLPWFMWIMGMGLSITLRKQLLSNKPRLHVFGPVLRRSLYLVALGLYLDNSSSFDFKTMVLNGVLQTLGVCYMVIGAIECLLMPQENNFRYGCYTVLSDLIESWRQWLVVLALAGAYVGIALALPVPGCPRGYMGPGGWHMHGQYVNCTGGAAGYIDRLILTPQHMPKYYYVYIYRIRQSCDHINLLGYLTSILMVYIGVHAGRILQWYNNKFVRISHWLSWALVTGIIGGILCNFSKEEGIIPLSRRLMSLSFVLATASLAFLLYTILYLVVDCYHWWSGAPFLYAGRNALVLYIGHLIALNAFPWYWKPFHGSRYEQLARDIWGTYLWLLIAYFMYRKHCFVTV